MNLEQFPTSDTAKRMMRNITGNGFYDNSYVGKWIFQVMGMEMDEARKIVEELPLQAFPETATWGLKYHEQKYGLPVKENLPVEERRRIILEKRNLKAPMTPWRMEIILKDLLGCIVSIEDINDAVNAIEHPNKFIVHLEGDGEFGLGKAADKVNAIKQSHTYYELRVRLAIFILISRFFLKTTIRTKLSWWGSVFPAMDGKYILDGSIRLNAKQPPFFVAIFKVVALNLEHISLLPIKHRILSLGTYGKITNKINYRMNYSWWEKTLDGKYKLDGSVKMDAVRKPIFSILVRSSVINSEAVFFTKAINKLPDVFNENRAVIRSIVRNNFCWNEGKIRLDGEYFMDGEIDLSNGSPPNLSNIAHRAKIKHEEEFNMSIYKPSDDVRMDGTYFFDGKKKLNSGREAL